MVVTSCQQLPLLQGGVGSVIASVGDATLSSEEIKRDTPSYLSGADSVSFVERYIDRWIARQVKVLEAERLFSSSAGEVEALVTAYRQTLLTKKLDQYYINSSPEQSISQGDIAAYYRAHSDNFRLNRNIVKGRILRLPLSYDGISKIKSMMASGSKDSQLNLISMSDKNESFELYDLSGEWLYYDDFIEMLPIVRDKKASVYMTRKGVQSLQDGDWCYLFEITAYRSAGYVSPLERVEGVIRQTLTNERNTLIVRLREQHLLKLASEQGLIYNHLTQEPEKVVERVLNPVLLNGVDGSESEVKTEENKE